MSPEKEPMLPAVEHQPDTTDLAHSARVAFGRYLKPEDYFVDPTFADLTPEDKAWFTTQDIEKALFRPPEKTLMVVRIEPDNPRSHRISLNQAEFALIGRHPDKLAESAFRGTLAAGEMTQERLAAARRSKIHAVTGRMESTANHLVKLNERKEELNLFEKKVKAAGWAHLSALNMQDLINLCSQELLSILDVLQARENWGDELRVKKEESMIYFLTQGSQKTRVEHWRSTVSMVKRYLNARIRTFQNYHAFSDFWLSKEIVKEMQLDDESS